MIHQYKLNGYNIVLDVNSGAVHVVDEIGYEILEGTKGKLTKEIPTGGFCDIASRYGAANVKEAYEELYSLQEGDQLFCEESYEKYISEGIKTPIKAMCLNVAHDCNLRCEYCFAAKGDFGTGRELMTYEVGKKAIEFLIERSGSRRNIELDFFGGEPLMNFGVVKKVVDYARSRENETGKKFRFTITTNGLLLDEEKIEYINREMSNVVLSLDGRKAVNDRLRITDTGKGCYDIIVPKYKKLVDGRGDKDYYVRGTFTKYNLDFTADVLHMEDLGFKNLSIEPVVSAGTLPYAITEQDLPKIFKEYEKLALEIIKRKERGEGFNFFHFMIDLSGGPCAVKRLKGCGCGNEYVSVTPNGDIFPCHQFVGADEHFKMGNLLEGSFKVEIKDYFSHANIYTKESCKECWAKFYCSGGCHANSYQYAGDILKAHKISCELEKKRLECAIMVKAAMQ